MAIAFLFLGPVPFLPVETKLSIIQGMVAMVGFGYALVMVSSFGRAQSAALKLGYADDINTYIMISGKFFFVETHNTTFANKIYGILRKEQCSL